jgi:flagellar basal body-associated protein FliL
MNNRTKIIIAVVIAGALLVGGYLLFFNSSNSSSGAVVSTSVSANTAEVTFLDLATQADAITFNTSILSDPRFTSLVDTSTTVVPVPEGRKDPFAPVPGITGN